MQAMMTIHTEFMGLPETGVQWVRLMTCLFGITAFGLLIYRIIGRADRMSLLSMTVTILLAMSVLAFGLGAARAEMLHNKFNELILIGLLVNIGATVTAIFWYRWLDKTGKRH